MQPTNRECEWLARVSHDEADQHRRTHPCVRTETGRRSRAPKLCFVHGPVASVSLSGIDVGLVSAECPSGESRSLLERNGNRFSDIIEPFSKLGFAAPARTLFTTCRLYMSIDCIDSFLVHPSHGKPSRQQSLGTRIKLAGKLFEMLERLFEKSGTDCTIDIAFRPLQSGSQANESKAMLTAHLRKPTPDTALCIAQHLASVTSNRSGLGLLFLICGTFSHGHRLVLARFPADQGVIAEERAGKLSVEFIEKVFMKSAHAYKCATYTCPDSHLALLISAANSS